MIIPLTKGLEVIVLERTDNLPDSVFVEDVAILTKDFAIITNPRYESRRKETREIEEPLKNIFEKRNKDFKVVHLTNNEQEENEIFLEGGDVIRFGAKKFIVGITKRTNLAGFTRFQELLESFKLGYSAESVLFTDPNLHLKCVATYLGNNEIIGDLAQLSKYPALKSKQIVDTGETTFSPNVLSVNGKVIINTKGSSPEFVKTLEQKGFTVFRIDNTEFSKLDGDITCRSLLF